jgi:predicted nucleic acid-binding protein
MFTQSFYIAEDGPSVTDKLIDLITIFPTGGKQIHDANIVATMLVNGISCLLTFNVTDFKRFAPEITLLSSEV